MCKESFHVKHWESYMFKCLECDKEMKNISEFKGHFGTYHYEHQESGENSVSVRGPRAPFFIQVLQALLSFTVIY